MGRFDHAQTRLDERRRELGVDALLIGHPLDIRWSCGFTGSNALLVWSGTPTFVTDGRYRDQALREVEGVAVHVPGYDLVGFLRESGAFAGVKRVAFASDDVTVDAFERYRSLFPEIEWVGVTGLLSGPRASKTASELAAIGRAQALCERVLQDVASSVAAGDTERAIAARITGGLLEGGAERTAFDPIVAAGERSAWPHARPTDRALRPGEPVLLDFGAVVDGYASDMTRMLSLGPPSDEFVRVHTVVASALERAEEHVVTGRPARDVDAAARLVIEDAGYGDAFPHSLGHGVGLDVHEKPTVSWRSADGLPDHAVITLEPGIYLSGRFGVRIEDMVLVTSDGAVRLTTVSRDLIVV